MELQQTHLLLPTITDDEAEKAIVQYEDKNKQGETEYNTGILTFQIIQ